MTTPSLNMTDSDIAESLRLIDDHGSNMRNAITHVEQVGSDISAAYRSTTSTQFQRQLEAWGEIYNTLLRNVDTMRTNLDQGKRGLNNANESGGQQVTGGLSSQITGVMTGA